MTGNLHPFLRMEMNGWGILALGIPSQLNNNDRLSRTNMSRRSRPRAVFFLKLTADSTLPITTLSSTTALPLLSSRASFRAAVSAHLATLLPLYIFRQGLGRLSYCS